MKFTKKLSVVAALTFGLAASASAADLSTPVFKAPPPAAPVFSWTGFYIGGQVGAGWGTTETDANVGAAVNAAFPAIGLGLNLPIGQTSMNGFIGGGHVGYNWQFGTMVYGLEGDFNGADIKGGTACILLLHCDSSINWTADITGRVGVTVGERALLYIKGGAAWADTKYEVNQSVAVAGLGGGLAGTVSGSATKTRFGGLLGAGVEYAFMHNWSVRLEYNYIDFGWSDVNMPIAASGAVTGGPGGAVNFVLPTRINEQVHTVTVGASYHF